MGRFLGLIVIIILIVFGGWFYWKFYYTYSDGNRTGLLQKFSHKGNLFKTYEGELVLSSVLQNNNASFSTEKFFFSVDKPDVAQKLMNWEGRRVVLHYEEKNGALFWRGDTKYIVDSVREGAP
jgi:hypothetical protein